MTRKTLLLTTFGLVLLAVSGGYSAAADSIRVGGTGSATEMIRFLAAKFAAVEELQVEIIPSLGSTGGIRAVEAGKLDIAVSGRSLNQSETSKGLVERLAVRSPWGLATSSARPPGLQSQSIAKTYRDENARWPDGTAIRVTLRPKGDSENQSLAEAFPGMTDALEALRRRTDLPIAATDQDNADWAERVEGSLVSITFTQIQMERRSLNMIAIDGVEPTFENFATGRYPYGKTLSFVTAAQPSPAALRFIAFLNSPEGHQVLRETGNLPVAR
jgi:phosphate transport system substrate-binding protein